MISDNVALADLVLDLVKVGVVLIESRDLLERKAAVGWHRFDRFGVTGFFGPFEGVEAAGFACAGANKQAGKRQNKTAA